MERRAGQAAAEAPAAPPAPPDRSPGRAPSPAAGRTRPLPAPPRLGRRVTSGRPAAAAPSGSRFPLAGPASAVSPSAGPAAASECPRSGLLAASTAPSRAACRCCQTRVSPRLLRDRGRGPAPTRLPTPAPAPPPRPAHRALDARSRGRSKASALRRRKCGCGPPRRGVLFCGPAGRCGGRGLGEACRGRGRRARAPAAAVRPQSLCSPDCWSAAAGVPSPSRAYQGTERVLEPRPSFLGSCGRPEPQPR